MGLVDDLIQKYEIYRKEMLPIYTKAAEDAYITQTPEMHTFGPEYDREAERNDYVQRFLKRIESYYPPAESLRYKFDLSWSVYEIAVPRMKKTDLNKLADKETKRAIAEEDYKNQIHAKIGNFVEDVVKVLRQETVEVCNRVTTSIKEGKVISGRTVASLKQFIDKFSELNFVGDDEIESQLEKVRREFLDPNNATTIQGDEELKEELGRRLGEIAEKASNITDINSVTGEYRRKISWE